MVTEKDQVAVPVPVKKRTTTAVKKVHPEHIHFGSPLNICRVCGEKYTYKEKPFTR
jgi:hypothetical protein